MVLCRLYGDFIAGNGVWVEEYWEDWVVEEIGECAVGVEREGCGSIEYIQIYMVLLSLILRGFIVD